MPDFFISDELHGQITVIETATAFSQRLHQSLYSGGITLNE